MWALGHELRYALRVLKNNPGFTAIALLVLALGIGANTAIFTLVDAVLLRPLPFDHPDRLVAVWEELGWMGFPKNTPAPANFVEWKKQNTVFDDMAAIRSSAFSLTGDGDPEQVLGPKTTPNLFRLLGVSSALGRTLVDSDDQPGAPKVVVLSQGLWVRRYGGNANILGKQILLDGEKHTVVGVMPRGFAFPYAGVQLYIPSGLTPKEWSNRDSHYLQVYARLKPGVSLERARSDMNTIAVRLQHDRPESNARMGAVVYPLREEYTGSIETGLWVLLAAVGFVLLIACANLANLLLARASARSREIAVRAALGAGRAQIARQLLTEGAVLSVGGAMAGIALAAASLKFLERLIPESMTGNVTLTLHAGVLAFTLGITAAAALLFGLAPALTASRVDLQDALKQGARGIAGGGSLLKDALVVGEVALALILLVGAGLLIQSLGRLRGVDLGFRPENVITFATPLAPDRYKKDSDRVAYAESVLERVRNLPGVRSAAFASDLPLVMKGNTYGFVREGYPLPTGGDWLDANYREITPGYLETMGIQLLRGRYLDRADNEQSKLVVVINDVMAKQFWPGRDPIGLRFKLGGPAAKEPWREIVGIVHGIHQMGIDAPARAEMYLPITQVHGPEATYLVIRSSVNPASLVSAVTREIHAVDAQLPVASIRSMDDVVDRELNQRRLQMTLLAGFSVLALLLASIGIYGVLAYAVTQRTPEIGVRMAVGARASDVLTMIASRGLGLAAAGIVIGAGGAFVLTRVLSSILFEVRPHDPATFAGVSVLLLGVALAASLVPAIRAARLDPIRALRNE
jgi:putative ABC transport system permease protein